MCWCYDVSQAMIISGEPRLPNYKRLLSRSPRFHCNSRDPALNEGMLLSEFFVNDPVFQKHLLSKLLVHRQSAILSQRNLFNFAKNIG